jgi:hypothetical protein
MNTFEENTKYFESEEYKKWLELANNKPKQLDIGYWICYFEGETIKWEFKKN